MPRIHYNAPAVLTFSILAILFCLINADGWCAVPGRGRFSINDPMDYLRLLTHVLGHGGWQHLLGNLTFILLLGPILEDRYGTGDMTLMILVTALVTGMVNILLSPHYLLGASGIVFMLIILASIVNIRGGSIPLTFILVAIIFIGKEVSDGLVKPDNVSQLTHIIGGLVGAVFGFRIKKR
jgi:membrane associated rhomboid family serine protease